MVGSIGTSVKEGQQVKRGDELGWFAFGEKRSRLNPPDTVLIRLVDRRLHYRLPIRKGGSYLG